MILKTTKVLVNKKAYYNYFIHKELEVGLILKGWETKSIRMGLIEITNAYVSIINKELFVNNLIINIKYQFQQQYHYNNKRLKKILLHKKEINWFLNKLTSGFTIIVLSLYWKNNLCKLKIALAKGKKKFDKRAILKNKDWQKWHNLE